MRAGRPRPQSRRVATPELSRGFHPRIAASTHSPSRQRRLNAIHRGFVRARCLCFWKVRAGRLRSQPRRVATVDFSRGFQPTDRSIHPFTVASATVQCPPSEISCGQDAHVSGKVRAGRPRSQLRCVATIEFSRGFNPRIAASLHTPSCQRRFNALRRRFARAGCPCFREGAGGTPALPAPSRSDD